jgi:hypothetical protein
MRKTEVYILEQTVECVWVLMTRDILFSLQKSSTVVTEDYLKVHKHEVFFVTFFAETESLWYQGPVTWDFWKSYSIRPRYSTFKHFRACSACDEIGSQFAQHAMKLVPRMLSVRWNLFRVCSAWIVHVKMFKFYHWLSMRGNSFLICSACDEIGSAYAQHAKKLFPRMLSIRIILKNCLGTYLIGPK